GSATGTDIDGVSCLEGAPYGPESKNVQECGGPRYRYSPLPDRTHFVSEGNVLMGASDGSIVRVSKSAGASLGSGGRTSGSAERRIVRIRGKPYFFEENGLVRDWDGKEWSLLNSHDGSFIPYEETYRDPRFFSLPGKDGLYFAEGPKL